EQPVPDESSDEVDLDVQAARRRSDRLEKILERGRLRDDLADRPGHGPARTRRWVRPRSNAAARTAAIPALIAAPRKTARSSVTIAVVTSPSYAGQLNGALGQSATGDGIAEDDV